MLITVDATHIRDFLLDLRIKGRSPKTIRAYRQAAEAYLKFGNGDLTRATVREWLASHADKQPSTQQLYLACLRAFVRWLLAEGLISEDPTARLATPPVKASPITPLTPQEVSTLLKAVQDRPRDTAILLTLMSSGMRISECAGILTENIDFDRQAILVLGKGSKFRLAPIDDRATSAIAKYLRRERKESPLADNPRLWLGQRGPLAVHGIDEMIRKAGIKAGIEDAHAHRFRHTFADRWLSDGGSEGGLMAVAGWSSRAMLDRYSAARATDRALSEYRQLRRRG